LKIDKTATIAFVFENYKPSMMCFPLDEFLEDTKLTSRTFFDAIANSVEFVLKDVDSDDILNIGVFRNVHDEDPYYEVTVDDTNSYYEDLCDSIEGDAIIEIELPECEKTVRVYLSEE
jgi:hypothetical protein